MRAVVQRVGQANVRIAGEVVAETGPGLLVLLGITHSDDVATARRLAEKVAGLRIFEDANGKMNLALADVGGSVLCVSQFTLYGSIRRGRRPSFDEAARPEQAQPLWETFCDEIERTGIQCSRGRFGAEMQVSLVNDGPVTLIVDSADLEQPRRT